MTGRCGNSVWRDTRSRRWLRWCLCAGIICEATGYAVAAGRGVAEALKAAGPLRDPEARARAVEEIRAGENAIRQAATEKANRLGLPLRGSLPGGGAWEIVDFEGDRPRYRTTLNANAGISVAANLLWPAPYGVTGDGGTIGVWDASGARVTHREFGGRVTVKDGSTDTVAHSTHVAGTLCAAGVSPTAKGMAPGAKVDSYEWNNDISEMTSRGASYPGEAGRIQISSHSYIRSTEGWYVASGVVATNIWYGSGATASGVEDDFGQYDTSALNADSLAYNLPYYLMFWAAGNDRNNNPLAGDTVLIGLFTYAYDPLLHPPGDGVYRGGYDTISHDSLGKNVVTVGGVQDAVYAGQRNVSKAVMLSYSSWGPTDDGRIKPDVVANGYGLYSSYNGGDALYGSMSGTSMACPNAAGVSQLLVHYLSTLFTNTAMRASTLKALLIHTADDLGNAGPDYRFGWGLVNAKAAADVLKAYQTNAAACRVVEDRVATARTSVNFSFSWDGASPIRATLCWTDPAGASTTAHDSRTPRLVNNLDLRVTGPTGTVYEPWVMPFVGNWTTNTLASPATTGSNDTDNVEQVLIAAPGAPGTYTARVTFAGTLSGGSQTFSLILTGGKGDVAPPAPLITASSPSSGTGTNLFTVTGDRFLLGADVRLVKAGQPDVKGLNVEAAGDTLESRLYTTGLADGWWHLLVRNPDGQGAVLYGAFLVGSAPARTFWREDFETDNIAAKGWTFLSDAGASQWALSTAASFSPTRSLYSPGAATRSDTSAVSPAIQIPASGAGFALSFWHAFEFESNDGGVLEFSLDGGAWYDVTASGSGASFASGGYNATIGGGGALASRNPLAGREGWSGTSLSFAQVVVNLTDTAKYAGHSLRVRWRLGTNSADASPGWTVDDVALSGAVPPDMTQATILTVR